MDKAAEILRVQLEILPQLDGIIATGGGRIVPNLDLGDFGRGEAPFRVRDIFALVTASRSGADQNIQTPTTADRFRPRYLQSDSEAASREDDPVLTAIREGSFATGALPTQEKLERKSSEHIDVVAGRSFMLARGVGPDGDVVCSVFSRPQAAAGAGFPVYVFLHEKRDLLRAAADALKRDRFSRRRAFETLDARLLTGQVVTLFLDSQDLLVETPLATISWTGRRQVATFDVSIPVQTKKDIVKGIVFISVDDIPVGEIPFDIAIGPPSAAIGAKRSVSRMSFVDSPVEPPDARPVSVAKNPRRYRKAFLSYSRKDVAWASIFAAGLTSNAIELFVDVTTMEPGDEWEEVLLSAIEGSDVFFLLWSENAADSKWVNKECSAACRRWELSGHLEPAIKPIILQDGAPKPPFCISKFHCDSRWRQMRLAGESKIFR